MICSPKVQSRWRPNKALMDFLAKEFGMKKSEIEIMSGHTSKVKKIKVVGQGTEIQKRIDMLVGDCLTKISRSL